MKTCAICGKEYEAHAPNSKYCSLECAHAARLKTAEKFRSENPHYCRDYMRQYRIRKKELETP